MPRINLYLRHITIYRFWSLHLHRFLRKWLVPSILLPSGRSRRCYSRRWKHTVQTDVSMILVCRCRETRNEEERLSTAENSIWKSDPVLRISASIYQSRKDHASVMDTADSTWTPYRVANRNQKPYQPPGLMERPLLPITEASLFPHVGFLI